MPLPPLVSCVSVSQVGARSADGVLLTGPRHSAAQRGGAGAELVALGVDASRGGPEGRGQKCPFAAGRQCWPAVTVSALGTDAAHCLMRTATDTGAGLTSQLGYFQQGHGVGGAKGSVCKWPVQRGRLARPATTGLAPCRAQSRSHPRSGSLSPPALAAAMTPAPFCPSSPASNPATCTLELLEPEPECAATSRHTTGITAE